MTIIEEFQTHLDGLIGGGELRQSESLWWLRLLAETLSDLDPVQKAHHYGFDNIKSVQDILDAIAYLAPIAAGNN